MFYENNCSSHAAAFLNQLIMEFKFKELPTYHLLELFTTANGAFVDTRRSCRGGQLSSTSLVRTESQQVERMWYTLGVLCTYT